MKRILSAVIAMVLVLAIFPLGVLAATEAVVYTKTTADTLSPGGVFTYDIGLSGTYSGYSLHVSKAQDGVTVTSVTAASSAINVDDMGDYWMVSVLGGLGKVNSAEETVATVTAVVDAAAVAGVKELSLSSVAVASDIGGRAIYEENYASVTVKAAVTGVPVTGVTLDNETFSLNVGEMMAVNATVFPAEATNKAIVWTSSEPTVASVSNGVITALKAGTAVITATTVDGGFTDTVTVIVSQSASATANAVVYTETAAANLAPGAVFTYDVLLSGTYDGYSLTLMTAQNGITVTGVEKSGNVDIDNNGDHWRICIVGGAGKTDSAKEKIATVTAVVDAAASAGVKELGFAEIAISSEAGGKVPFTTVPASVTVTAAPVYSLTLSEEAISLKAGEMTAVTATLVVPDGTDKTVSWKSSDEKVATVSDGIITGLKAGVAVITATAADGKCSDTVVVTVTGMLPIASGNCGQNLTWVLAADGTLTISGTGTMNTFDDVPWAAYTSSIRRVVIENGVTNIGVYAFRNCTALTSVSIPASVKSISGYAFDGCISLKEVTIPNSVSTIASFAFSHCSALRTIVIPASVTTVQPGAFEHCPGLVSIDVDAGNAAYIDVDGVLFTKDKTKIVQYPAGKTAGTYAIPDGTVTIEHTAFSSCAHLSKVTIPDSVTSIGGDVFYGCVGLTSIVIPEGITEISSRTFKDCINLRRILLPKTLTKIGTYAFEGCSNLRSVILPDSVTSLGGSAFGGCTALEKLIVLNNEMTIGTSAITTCGTLYGYAGSTAEQYDSWRKLNFVSLIAHGSFGIDGDNLIWVLASDGSLIVTGIGAMWETDVPVSTFSLTGASARTGGTATAPWDAYRSIIKSVEITEGVTTIAKEAFSGCTALENVSIPDGITEIAEEAFSGCTALETVSIPETTEHVGAGAFAECASLTAVSVEGSTTTIADTAFTASLSVTFMAPAGSAAETFAAQQSIPCEPLPVKVTGVSLNKNAVTLAVDETDTLIASVTPADAAVKTVSWTSSNKDVVSVADGVITAKAPGAATITAVTTDGEFVASCTVTVPVPSPAGVTVSGTAVSWNDTDDAMYLLYAGTATKTTIQSEWASGVYTNALYTAEKGSITGTTVSGKAMKSQSFTFEGVADGTYKLVILKPGKYVPKIVEITVSGADMDAGQQKLWLYGDVIYDGTVNNQDVLQIKRYIAKIGSVFSVGTDAEKAEKLEAANILAFTNPADEVVNNQDVLQISRYIAKIGSVFNNIH